MPVKSYLGNPNLKAAGVEIGFTKDQIEEYLKCAEDPIYFINTYCMIVTLDHGLQPFKLYPCQINKVNIIHKERKVILMEGRQQGKTTTSAAYILWYTIFQESKTVAILANKAPAAREVLYRYQLMYENLPMWLQQGVTTWNKGDIALENGSIVFTAATSASGIRGKSCVVGDTKICLENNNDFFYVEIVKMLNNIMFFNVDETMIKYVIYKTTDNVNGKIYYGFHSIDERKISRTERGPHSCFADGYLGSGKLIKSALEKYGPENFEQEIISIHNTKQDAEKAEATLVNVDFVLQETNYNLAIGGNVRSFPGENNPFFGKKHTQESLDRIQETRQKNGLPTYQTTITNNATLEVYKGYSEALLALGFVQVGDKNISSQRRRFIAEMVSNGTITINNTEFQEKAKHLYDLVVSIENNKPERKKALAESCALRFKGKKQSQETVLKRVDANKKWIEKNPELHKQKMEKINKNPEKIAKTAEKNRGSKRTAETKANISSSLKGKPSHTKGKTAIWNPETLEVVYIEPCSEVPSGWKLGRPKRTSSRGVAHNNSKIIKFFKDNEIIPEGWVKGALPKPRRT